MNAGPCRGGAGLPENRVSARSSPPQKKLGGLHLPMKLQRDATKTRSTWTRIRQKRWAHNGSYEWCCTSCSKRIGEGTSTGIDQILTGSDRSASSAITSR